VSDLDAEPTPEPARVRLSWRTWVFIVLAVGWLVVALVSSRDRGLAWGLAVVAALLALVNVNRDRRRTPSA
jgi:lysylphosphatidylglycerol synthetase-like protein (DUF2156 family)